MYIQTMKWASIAALLLAMLCWNSLPIYQVALTLVVTLGAVLVLVQAVQAKRYWWAAGFLGIALLFDPALPIVRLAGAIGFCLVVLAIAPFAASLVALKPPELLSIPSITSRSPRSQSL
jgi:hypothetical protein